MLHAKAIFSSTCIARGFSLSEKKFLHHKVQEPILYFLLSHTSNSCLIWFSTASTSGFA